MTDTQKIALVTGASRGLGAALALELSKTHHVVAVGRTTGALEELDDKIKLPELCHAGTDGCDQQGRDGASVPLDP